MLKRITNNSKSLYLVTLLLLLSSCTKENTPVPASSSDSVGGRILRYTIMVVMGENSSLKSTTANDSVYVSLVVNDSIFVKTANDDGMVYFDNIAAGNTAVIIRKENYTTANYIVDLSIDDSISVDSKYLRNASSMVALFPTSGSQMGTITGRALANLDLTQAGLETALSTIIVSSVVSSAQFPDYINHEGSGKIIQISYQNILNTAKTDANGDYLISVPASAKGLDIVIRANDFSFDKQIAASVTQRKVYTLQADTIQIVSGATRIHDLIYQ